MKLSKEAKQTIVKFFLKTSIPRLLKEDQDDRKAS